MIDKTIKSYADSGDLTTVKYIFVDALDVDPTFEQYRDSYEYCRSVPGFLEEHRDLTPLTEDRSKWTKEYWVRLKTDLSKNFSDRRMRHMCEVAKVFMAEKVERLTKERQRPVPTAPQKPSPAPAPAPVPTAASSGEAEQRRKLEEAKRKLEEAERRTKAEQNAQEKRIQQRKEEYKQASQSTPSTSLNTKKLVGVAIAVAAVIVAIIVALLLHRSPSGLLSHRNIKTEGPSPSGMMTRVGD